MNTVDNLIYPEQPGIYLAQNKKLVCIVRFTGWYPNLTPSCGILLNNLIGTSLNEDDSIFIAKQLCKKDLLADKDVLNSIAYDRGEWQFSVLPVNFNEFDVWEKRYCEQIMLPDYKVSELYYEYMRMLQSGISWQKMASVIKVKCNCSTENAIKLINKFDQRMHARQY